MTWKALVVLVALAAAVGPAAAQPAGGDAAGRLGAQSAPAAFALGLPPGPRPVVVDASFELRDVNDIDDEAERFEFTGVLTLRWQDPRQAFDPAVAGVDEKIFQGSYQFDELSPGWYPQIVLANASGRFEASGVLLRVAPDGTSTLVTTLDAAAEAELDMRLFPFDRHRFEAVFEVLGFGSDEVVLRADPEPSRAFADRARVPQWSITAVGSSAREQASAHAGTRGVASAFVLRIDAVRDSFYISRLIIMPLVVIVFLSFSVFWMDRSSLGDRINLSFIGILTGVAYQLVMSDHLPRISYVTVMHGFLNLSFLTMCATVGVNLVVGARDKRGDIAGGDRLDRRCRWGFPLGYVGLNALLLGVAFLVLAP